MKKYLLVFTLLVSSFSCYSANLINDEQVTEQKNCFSSIFSDYASWRGFIENNRKKRIKTEEELSKGMLDFDSMFGEEKFNQYKSNLSCITFKYPVDGLEVSGYVIKPKSNTKKLPVLIYNRGGNGKYGSVVFGAMMHNLFSIANDGFVIIGSQYRLSQTKGIFLDEFGGKDVDDVVALLDYIPKLEGADANRVGMFGASRGGMQTFLALKKARNVKAVAIIAGSSDLLKDLEYRPEMENVYKHRIPDYENNKINELEKRSVIKWLSDLPPLVPILLLHGTRDERVSVNNSIELAEALSKTKIPYKLVLYPEDNHDLTINKAKANHELVSWFKEYL